MPLNDVEEGEMICVMQKRLSSGEIEWIKFL